MKESAGQGEVKRVLRDIIFMGFSAWLTVSTLEAQIDVTTLQVVPYGADGDYIETATTYVQAHELPAKLRYLARDDPYISIFKYLVEPGRHYSLRMEYRGDGREGSLMLMGDDPLTDYDQAYGPEHLARRLWLHRSFPGDQTSHCTFSEIVNFQVSDESEHNNLWVVAYSREPKTAFALYLWQPAMADDALRAERYKPCLGESLSHPAGRVEQKPFWLSYDPSEKSSRTASSATRPASTSPLVSMSSDGPDDDFDLGEEREQAFTHVSPEDELEFIESEEEQDELVLLEEYGEGPRPDPAAPYRPSEAPKLEPIDPGGLEPNDDVHEQGHSSRGCGFTTMGEWSGATQETVFEHILDEDSAYSNVAHTIDAPGPGRLRVTLGVSGEHEVANNVYGAQRFRASLKLFSAETVVGNTWISGGEYYPGVEDYGENERTFDVEGAGEIMFRLIPERCRMRMVEGRIRCWTIGQDRLPGIKLLPMNYQFRVEFDPCR